CLTIKRNDHAVKTSKWLCKTGWRLQQEKSVADWIDGMSIKEFEDLMEQVSTYFDRLRKKGLSDKTLAPTFAFGSKTIPFIIAGFPIYLTGCILNIAPFLMSRYIVNSKVYR